MSSAFTFGINGIKKSGLSCYPVKKGYVTELTNWSTKRHRTRRSKDSKMQIFKRLWARLIVDHTGEQHVRWWLLTGCPPFDTRFALLRTFGGKPYPRVNRHKKPRMSRVVRRSRTYRGRGAGMTVREIAAKIPTAQMAQQIFLLRIFSYHCIIRRSALDMSGGAA